MIPRVYIAGPYTSDDEQTKARNVHNAVAVACEVLAAGCHPVIPHLCGYYCEHINDSYEWWLQATLNELQTCAACALVPGWRDSKGSRGEFHDCVAQARPHFEASKKGSVVTLPDEFFAWVTSVTRKDRR